MGSPRMRVSRDPGHPDFLGPSSGPTTIVGYVMDSINAQQPESNRADLKGQAAIARARELADKAQTCFFSTGTGGPDSAAARPMSVQEMDETGSLWFLSADDSHKNAELAVNPSVTLYFQASPHADFLVLHGQAEMSRDKKKIKQLWEPIVKTWFTEGVDDPRITVIRVKPTHGYYWTTKHGKAIAGAKMLIGAAIGKTLDDSMEGHLAF